MASPRWAIPGRVATHGVAALLLAWSASVAWARQGATPAPIAAAIVDEGDGAQPSAPLLPEAWRRVREVDLGSHRVQGDAAIDGPKQIGVTIVPRAPQGAGAFVLADLASDATWDVTEDDRPRARLVVRVSGGGRIRLKLDAREMEAGSSLSVSDGAGMLVSVRGAEEAGAQWTGSIEGQTALVEFVGPAGSAVVPAVELLDVAVISELDPSDGPAPDGAAVGGGARRVGTCAIGGATLACHAAVPSGQTLQRAVMLLTFVGDAGGVYSCTGTLVRDPLTGSTQVPYVLTAAHCINTASEARTVEAIWFYFAQGGAAPCLRNLPFNEGASLAGTVASTDVSVLVLDSAPPSDAYAAPLRLEAINGSERGFTSIHHAGAGEQRFFSRPAMTGGSCLASNGSWRAPENYEFSFVAGQSDGVVEGGSSGAPLIDSQGYVRGTLQGVCYPGGSGFDFCTQSAGVRHYFGSFARAWQLGLSSAFAPPPADDTLEPNDSASEARLLSAGGSPRALQLIDLDDYFRVSLASAGTLNVTISGQPSFAGQSFDADLFVLDTSSRVLASSTSASASESITWRAGGAGDVLLRVQRYSDGTHQTGSYTLTVRFTADPGSAQDDGASPAAQTSDLPAATSVLVDRSVAALDLRIDRLLQGALIRAERSATAIEAQVAKLRARNVAESSITLRIDRALLGIDRLGSAARTNVERSRVATQRSLERLAEKRPEQVDAVAAALAATIPDLVDGELSRLDEAVAAARARVEALRAAAP